MDRLDRGFIWKIAREMPELSDKTDGEISEIVSGFLHSGFSKNMLDRKGEG